MGAILSFLKGLEMGNWAGPERVTALTAVTGLGGVVIEYFRQKNKTNRTGATADRACAK
jgi:hypothetical protein